MIINDDSYHLFVTKTYLVPCPLSPLSPLFHQIFVVVPFVRDVNPTSARLQEILPGLRVIEAQGQHDDLEDRIDSFSAGNNTV